MISLKEKIKRVFQKWLPILIPIFQFIPALGPWRGMMSAPAIIFFFILLFVYPEFFNLEISYLLDPRIFLFEKVVTFIGFVLFIYSAIYLNQHKNGLVTTGPYKYVRHPQYLGIIIMTLGLTLLSFHLTPSFIPFASHALVAGVWFGEVLAYVLLAKIEEFHLKSKYNSKYMKYENSVPFMVPFLKTRAIKETKT